jgi:hypothetical protein
MKLTKQIYTFAGYNNDENNLFNFAPESSNNLEISNWGEKNTALKFI